MGQAAASQLFALLLALPLGLVLAAVLLEGVAAKRGRDPSLAAAGLLIVGAACLFALVAVLASAVLVHAGQLTQVALYASASSAAVVALTLFLKLKTLQAKSGATPYRIALGVAVLSFVAASFFPNAGRLGGEVAAAEEAPTPSPAAAPSPASPGERPAPAPQAPSAEEASGAVASIEKPPTPDPDEPDESAPAVAAVDPNPAPEPGTEQLEATPAPTEVAGTDPTTPEPTVEPTPPDPVVQPAVEPAKTDPPPAATPVVFAQATPEMYVKLIAPIFKNRCYDCHSEDKQKGDLRLDSPEWIRKGGKSGPVLVAGVPQESYIYELISLEADDSDIMPPKGKPLTERQIAFIRRWILEGAGMDDGEEWPVSASAVAAATNTGFGIDALAGSVPPPDASVVGGLEEKGIYVRPLSANGALLEVDFSHADFPAGGIGLAQLAPLAPNIYALDLKRTKITDDDLAQLSGLSNLRKLSLQRTEITDNGLKHVAGLSKLEVINLYSTDIGDAGVKHLEGLKNLKEVYLFETKVSTAGALALRVAVPLAKVDLGAD